MFFFVADRMSRLVAAAGWTLVALSLSLSGVGVSVTRADPAARQSTTAPERAAATCEDRAPLATVRLDPKRIAPASRSQGEFVSLNTRGYNYQRQGLPETAPQVAPEKHVSHEKPEEPGSK